jgi:hypothetical protein
LLFGIPAAFLLMIYRAQLKQYTGDIDFAEKYLGAGGTYTFFVLLGLAVFVISVMYAFGTFQEIFQATLGHLFI